MGLRCLLPMSVMRSVCTAYMDALQACHPGHTPSAMVCSCLRVGAALRVATYSRVMPADGCVTCCAH